MDDAETQSVLSAIVFGMIIEDNPSPVAASTLQVLSKIVSNALGSSDPKFRKLPATNDKIRSKIIEVSGASEFLDAIGFTRHGDGDFLLSDDSKLRLGASVLDDALAALPRVVAAPTPAASKVEAVRAGVNSASTSEDAEYERRKQESEVRQAEIKRKMEEDKRKKEELRLKIKAEQREVRDRPVVASHAVHFARPDNSSGGGGDGKIRYTNTDKEFQSVISSKPLVIANFTASWCGPCQNIAPMIEEMARTNTKVTFIKIDIDENNETPSRYNVTAVPTFILFKNGQPAGEVKGANAQAVQGLVAQA